MRITNGALSLVAASYTIYFTTQFRLIVHRMQYNYIITESPTRATFTFFLSFFFILWSANDESKLSS